MRIRPLPVLGLVLMTLGACRPTDQRTDTLDPVEASQKRAALPPEVTALLDSGSALFRVDSFEAALEQYTRVTEIAPDVAAGWFGVFMVEHALGNIDAAQAAIDRAQSAVPGATLIHPTTVDTVR